MSKRFEKNRHEAKSGLSDPLKRPRKSLPDRADRKADGSRGHKGRSTEHIYPSARTRDLPEKAADQNRGDLRGHRETNPFSSFDRPKKKLGFTSSDKRPVPPRPQKTVSAAALKRGFEKAKDEIAGMCDEMSSLMTSRYNIGKVQLTVSFNEAGEFIGFGTGGAVSIKITIIPSK